jgi:hypothetical protein
MPLGFQDPPSILSRCRFTVLIFSLLIAATQSFLRLRRHHGELSPTCHSALAADGLHNGLPGIYMAGRSDDKGVRVGLRRRGHPGSLAHHRAAGGGTLGSNKA